MFRFPASVMPVSLRLLGAAAVVCSAMNLVGCGGGSRAKDYQPDRIVVFGDENSAFTTATVNTDTSYTIHGLVYTVNSTPVLPGTVYFCGNQTATTVCDASSTTDLFTSVTNFVATDTNSPQGTAYRLTHADPVDFNLLTMIAVGTGSNTVSGTTTDGLPMKRSLDVVYDCSASATWMQTLAHAFGKGFQADCTKDLAGAVTHATYGAYVADIQTQINASLNASELGDGTLVAIWAGHNDIIQVYESGTYGTIDAKVLEIRNRAQLLANMVIQVMNTGAKVVVIGAADLGYSPYGKDKKAAITGTPACDSGVSTCNGDLQRMAKEFNDALLLTGLRDYVYQGRKVAFIDPRETTDFLATNSSYVNDRVCDASKMVQPDGTKNSAVQFCNALGFVTNGSTATYLWADDTHPAWVLHSNIGVSAYNRAANQF
ncbi:hypothetical protein JY96_13210 [Aquabacterium sp. NJ1]|uniref:hypothetical protein n=1 Tax=Aquabacterium sp. NJ1 TaxID=1538295 RepID=UPI00052C0AD0|nr:hypothetical protein [Aquabacterium sp. NJ1]KGM40675.1 hypothetical protein JY96_13210 [Aquabacterium sp. NJ1]